MMVTNTNRLAELLTERRLASYLGETESLDEAISLYDWNVEACSAILGTVAMVEVVVRNAMAASLRDWANARGSHTWVESLPIDSVGRRDLADAVWRASRRATGDIHGATVSELSFGFWRYLAARRYLTSLWIPALHRAFPRADTNPGQSRRDVEFCLEQLVFVRNRAAHHEPIHRRDLLRDFELARSVVDKVDSVASDWIVANSKLLEVTLRKPTRGR